MLLVAMSVRTLPAAKQDHASAQIACGLTNHCWFDRKIPIAIVRGPNVGQQAYLFFGQLDIHSNQ